MAGDTVLVPLDGSAAAERAIPIGLALALRAGARLRLVHVHEGFAFATVDEAETYLVSLLDRMRVSAPDLVAADVIRGDAVEVLLHEIKRRHVELVAMTTHGAGGLRGAPVGTVASRLVQESRTPVLVFGPVAIGWGVVRERSGPIIDALVSNVLVALDGSPVAEATIADAAQLARLFGARITLLTVLVEAKSGGSARAADLVALHEGTALATLERLSDNLTRAGVPANRRVIHTEDAVRGILRGAAEEDADIIALAAPLSGPRRAQAPSLAMAVIAVARQPVLVYRSGLIG
jgi:nucleotide-binding universal stress UspA family protein